MHKWSALLLLTAELLWAQAPNTAGRLADLEFVGTQLPKLCLNFYSQVSPTAYAAAVAALRAQIRAMAMVPTILPSAVDGA